MLSKGLCLLIVCRAGRCLEQLLGHDGSVEHRQRRQEDRIRMLELQDDLIVALGLGMVERAQREIPNAPLRIRGALE